MELDSKAFYMMPAHFGAMDDLVFPGYHDVLTIQVAYLTDRDRLARYLPKPFEVGDEPLVTVFYSMNREVDWLAGGSYNVIGVNAAVAFHGEADRLHGSYCLVLWENSTDPIISGREIQGIPKVYGDVEDHKIRGGTWRTSVSHHNHKILDVTVKDLIPLKRKELAEMEKASNQDNWMGWKYIPREDGIGAALSHATLFPIESRFKEGWTGSGRIQWHRLAWEQNPTQAHIANALEALPILEMRPSFVIRGSTKLGLSEVRRLR